MGVDIFLFNFSFSASRLSRNKWGKVGGNFS